MDRYKDNAKWLTYLTPFRTLSISAAYLTPFFLLHGLSLAHVLLLQSIFSVAVLLWEIPSGLIADKCGRAFSIKLSAPIASLSMILYGFSDKFWQFLVCELILAIAYGLISGIDTALLYDSLKADGNEDKFVKLSQRMNAFGFAATAVGVPIAMALVHFVGLGSTLVADGLLLIVGMNFTFRLVEAPRSNGSQEAIRLSAWHAMKQLGRNANARWLIILGSVLSAATYMTAWLSAPYYSSMGIPLVLFSAVLAVRSLWKAWLSQHFTQDNHIGRNMVVYAALAGLVYVAMASGKLWLIWAVLGHDVVQALASQPITSQLNQYIHGELRATLNSVVNLAQRLTYSLSGPFVGYIADKWGLSICFLITGACFSTIAFIAVFRLHQLKTFKQKR